MADNPGQAAEDLSRDWATRNSPTWAIDIATPDWGKPGQVLAGQNPADRAHNIAIAAAESKATNRATTGVLAPDLRPAIAAAQADVENATKARADLARGAGVYSDSEAGKAVRDLAQASAERQRAEQEAEHAHRWRDRRAASKEQAAWAKSEADAQLRHQTHVTPEVARLDRQIESCRAALNQLEAERHAYSQALHTLLETNATSSRTTSRLSKAVSAYRDEIDGVPRPAPHRPTGVQCAHPLGLRGQALEPPVPEPPSLSLGL